jgi:hypothetical protein
MTIVYPEELLAARVKELEAAGNDLALYASHLLNCRYGTVMQHTVLGGETVTYEALPCTCGYSAAVEAWHRLIND